MKSSRRPETTTPERKPADKRREGDVRHILDKALPPGVDVDDVQDPGKSFNGTPADDRS
jgi:hypothetical protein